MIFCIQCHILWGAPEFPSYAPVNVNVMSLQRRISENFDAARLPSLLSFILFTMYQATFSMLIPDSPYIIPLSYTLPFVPEIKTDTKTIK